jgi:hypothetical protein
MSEFSLTAKAVNAATKADAVSKGLNIWEVVANDIAVISVSPEMLATFVRGVGNHTKKCQLVGVGIPKGG